MIIRQPLEVVEAVGKFDVLVVASGGGIAGQAGAIRHGISKAIVIADPELRPTLRRQGYLTRDPRVKERKKYGRKRARRGFQFSKR
jgi:small subunit ribosomal protein S9